MEWLASALIVLFIVLLVGGLFAALGARGPWPGLIWFLLVLFVATWALGSWVRPIGPLFWDVPWLTFLIVAVLIAVLIAAATPGGADRRGDRAGNLPLEGDSATTPAVGTHHHLPRDPGDATAAATALGVFFWIFLIMAVAIFLLSLVFPPVL